MNKIQNHQTIPISNRVFFALITLVFSLAFIKVIYWAIYQGRPPMNLIAWLPIFGLTIVGLLKITFKGDIRLRVHKIWTPLGLLAIVWVYYCAFTTAIPLSNGLVDLLFNQTSEGYLWITAFGLIIAFIDWNAFHNYSYFFTFYAIYVLIFFSVSIFELPAYYLQHGFQISISSLNEQNDFFSLLSGPFFAYFIVLKLKTEWPGWKKIGIAFATFIVFFFVMAILSGVIGESLPKESWIRQVLKSEAPPGAQRQGGTPL